MALIRGKKNPKTQNKITSATIITSCMEVTGNLHGSDTVHIDGKVVGDIIVSNTLVIGKSGMVQGEVKAKNAIINGTLEGSIICETLEVMETGEVSKQIQADTMILDGTVTGYVIGLKSIEIQSNATLTVEKIESKKITVSGSVKGNLVASELLEINSTGSVEGEISVKAIKTAEGSRMVGTMSTYEEEKEEEKAQTA
ncbi:polymer-forming cytoskeletal protein [Sulfurovum sp. XGS-02]|uniref:bactofilin family protein n=1 Tax=Sulfurovum sp. XGS-02 TaxID=2925411 RepID=UPI0020575877|nr:polymer-forming cytoskeletal protein [Sulfurovum sp. XGS-02]UPT76944.1 polymer-forming cytoskeletal protein [Sulfurovum sp. XGS-02]